METFDENGERKRREDEATARAFQYMRQKYVAGPCLVTLQADAEGWDTIRPYDGGPYDASKYRIEAGGWKYEECWVCGRRIAEGEEWWAALPPDKLGLCDDCHARLFVNQSSPEMIELTGPQKEELARKRREAEETARKYEYTRQTFVPGPSLVALQAFEGWIAVIPYYGGPYDSSKYRVEPTGWDHQHCSVCWRKIEEGDHWWAAPLPDEIGLCDECHARLMGDSHELVDIPT